MESGKPPVRPMPPSDRGAKELKMQTNDDLQKRRLAAVARGIASTVPVFCERAENAELWDVEGRRYFDAIGGPIQDRKAGWRSDNCRLPPKAGLKWVLSVRL